MADRFFCAQLAREGRIVLDGDEARHLARVARRVVGDRVELFDGRGLGVVAKVEAIGRDRVDLEATGIVADREPGIGLSLLVAVPKGDRFDWLVEKATELGVRRLVPLRASRSVVDPRSSKLDRLRRAILEASKQCGRNRFMTLEEPMAAAEAFARETSSLRLMAEAGGAPVSRWPALAAGDAAALAIGPEGGWTGAEIEAARASGWSLVGLGPTRLRVETAALAGAAIVLSRAEGEIA